MSFARERDFCPARARGFWLSRIARREKIGCWRQDTLNPAKAPERIILTQMAFVEGSAAVLRG
jgi:hypothetical protein